MQKGYLQGDDMHGIMWVNKLIPLGLGEWKKDSEQVGVISKVGISAVPTHICKQCKLFVGDYSENNE